MTEAFYKLIRSPEGPFVSVELDDSLDAGFAFLQINVLVGVIATALPLGLSRRLTAHRFIVRVGVSRGTELVTSSHGYPKQELARLVAQRLVDEIGSTGLSAIADWNIDSEHWMPQQPG